VKQFALIAVLAALMFALPACGGSEDDGGGGGGGGGEAAQSEPEKP